jgi:hypothetical protein
VWRLWVGPRLNDPCQVAAGRTGRHEQEKRVRQGEGPGCEGEEEERWPWGQRPASIGRRLEAQEMRA